VVESLLARGLYLAVRLHVFVQQCCKGFGRMRNALLQISLIGASLVPTLAYASQPDIDQSVLVPAPASIYSLDLDHQLLPVKGSDLPLSTSTAASGTKANGPQASVVEAIPTPTAFHAGGVLLIAMFAARYFRKLRIN
jgi:hypothetical protein